MPATAAQGSCPNCGQLTDATVAQCASCRFLHLGKLANRQPVEGEAAPAPHPTASEGNATSANDGLVMVGWVTAIVFPIIGLIVGIVLAGRSDKRGTHIVIAATAFFLFWILVWVVLVAALGASAQGLDQSIQGA